MILHPSGKSQVIYKRNHEFRLPSNAKNSLLLVSGTQPVQPKNRPNQQQINQFTCYPARWPVQM
uniref:Uncharacterized protein n=1 Tax=Rhizophora mucronata TaxID=61149 RepID=A0A2P2IH45_RHIMU